MEPWRVTEELDFMAQWDPDALCDALNLSTEELLEVPFIQRRALRWIEDNNG